MLHALSLEVAVQLRQRFRQYGLHQAALVSRAVRWQRDRADAASSAHARRQHVALIELTVPDLRIRMFDITISYYRIHAHRVELKTTVHQQAKCFDGADATFL